MSLSKKIILLVGTIGLIRLGFFIAEQNAEAKADEAIVRSLDGLIVTEMPLDGSLAGHYGDFIRLSGTGFRRERDERWGRLYFEGLRFERTAVFTKGSIPLRVTLHCAPSTTLGEMRIEITQWYCPDNKLPLTINAHAPGEPKTLIH